WRMSSALVKMMNISTDCDQLSGKDWSLISFMNHNCSDRT
ncbi:hypothetical protein AVDCRST_MAG81-235, partial [uncultured Synechococcales cyanobacterium]